MNGSRTFRFHRFTEEEKKPYRYAATTTNNNFNNSNTYRNLQKIRTFQNKLPNIILNNNNINTQSYQFTTKYSANIPKITKTFQLTNNNYNNKLLYSDNNIVGLSNFPLKQLTNIDFESILYNGDLTQIDKFLPQMLYNNLSFSNNNHFTLVIKKFQTILRFLFSEQEQLLNNNNAIEDLFNNKNSNLNKKIKQIEQEDYRTKNLLNLNQKQIGRLIKKINNYKNILISSGNEKYIPNKKLLYYIRKDGLFTCQICRSKIFKSYEDIHAHFIKEHFSSYDNKNIIYNNNTNKKYFENQLNIFKNELKTTLLDIKKQYDEDDNKKDDNIKIENKNNNNFYRTNNRYETNTNQGHKSMSSNKLANFNNFNLNSNNDINLYLEKLENEQKKHYTKLNDDLNQLKKDILNEIKNIAISQPISDNNKNIINIIEKKTIISDNNNNNLKNIKDNNFLFQNDFNNNNNIKNQENDKNYNINIHINNNNNNDNNDINNNFDNNINNINNNEDNNKNEFNDKNKIEENIKKSINISNNNDNINNDNNNININLNINQSDKQEINISNNKPKIFTTSKYNPQIVIKEESGINESSIINNNINNNNKDESKITYTPAGNPSLINNSKFNDNPYSIDKKMLSTSKIGDSINNNIVTKPPDKNEFIELYNKRETETLFNQNNILSDISRHYPILKNKKNSDETIEHLINEEENKYLNNKNEDSINVNEYTDIIVNIINENNNKGKNNSLFKKYYENIIQKNNLTDILEKMEENKKKKEMEKLEEEEKRKKKEEEKRKKEENIKESNKKNMNFGFSNQIDFGDILNDNASQKENKDNENIKKTTGYNSDDSILDKIDKKGGDDFI